MDHREGSSRDPVNGFLTEVERSAGVNSWHAVGNAGVDLTGVLPGVSIGSGPRVEVAVEKFCSDETTSSGVAAVFGSALDARPNRSRTCLANANALLRVVFFGALLLKNAIHK